MTGSLCLEEALHENMQEDEVNSIWADFLHAFTEEKQMDIEAKKSKVRDVMMGLFKGQKDGIDTNFQLSLPYRVYSALDLPSAEAKQKPHRLVVLQPGI